jgi:hypothetical protein
MEYWLLNFRFFKFITFLQALQRFEQKVAEKASWDPANRGQKLGLIWKTKRKSVQIISDDHCFPFCLLFYFMALGCSSD